MHPILLRFSDFFLYTQTVFFGVAFLAGLLVAVHEGKRFAIYRVDITDVVLWSFLWAIPGARLLFMVLNRETASFTLSEFCTLGTLDGGFSFHGGLVIGGCVGFLVARHHKLPVWRLADALAPALAIAMFFMRIGCVLNGCCYGVETTIFWGIHLHGASRHPTQLYEGIGNLFLLPLLIFLNKKPLKQGQVFLLYLLLSALLRLGVDFYREDSMRVWGVLTVPQLISIGIAILSGSGVIFDRINKMNMMENGKFR